MLPLGGKNVKNAYFCRLRKNRTLTRRDKNKKKIKDSKYEK
jgi:hypothetical protein